MAEKSKFKQSPARLEVTSWKSPYYEKGFEHPYNPDDLYIKKGNYDIYDKMRDDDQIKSILYTKKTMILGTGWDIEIDNEIPIHEEIKEKIKKWLSSDIELSFDQSLKEMLSNLDYGFSISEPVWKIEDMQVKLKYIKTRVPHSFEIHLDDKGNIKFVKQHQDKKGAVDIAPSKLIVFPYQMEFGNWYGKSDLRAAYRSWWSKDIIIKFWNIYLEKFGTPTSVGKYDVNISTQEDIDTLQTSLKNLQTATGITIPNDMEIEFIEATSKGVSGYENAIDKYNMMIARSMLLPDLVGLGGSETSGGSFSLGLEQFKLFYNILEDTRKELERIINRRIIQPLVDFNFNIGENEYPEFKLNIINHQQRVEMLRSWTEMVKGTGIVPTEEEINWARRITGAPEGDVEFITQNKDEINDETTKPTQPSPGEKKTEKPTKPEDINTEDQKQLARVERKPLMAEKGINFQRMIDDIDKLENRHIERIAGAITTVKDSLIETVKKGKFIENKRLDKVKDLSLKNTSGVRSSIKTMLMDFHGLGLSDGKEILKITEKKFIAVDLEAITEEIINTSPVFISDKLTTEILEHSKLVLSSAIKDGLSLTETVKELNAIFSDYDPTFNGHRLENIVRTNSLKAYNQTQQAFYQPFVSSGDIAAFQYSSIIDTRTTAFCLDHNGKIYLADSAYLQGIEPPNHFQCRAILIPITKIEFEGQEILGATKEQNEGFFKNGNFKESKTFADKYKREPGGFFVKKR